MAEVTIRIEVDVVITQDGDGWRDVVGIRTVDGGVLASLQEVSARAERVILDGFSDQISEALVWARSDDVAAAADAKNEGSV